MGFFSGFFNKEKKKDLDQGLEKTKKNFFGNVAKAVVGKSKVDVSVLDELEQALISSDVSLDTTIKIIDRLEERIAKDKYISTSELNQFLYDEIEKLLVENKSENIDNYSAVMKNHQPYVLLVVGVNGVGKTTTIGKLAHHFMQEGKSVVLGAGDTFRAAAVDQLKIWTERTDAHFYSKGMHTDPAAVAYETVDYAINNEIDIAIIDTAGRLHNKKNLMNELSKIKRSINKRLEGAPHDVLLVLDATTGQNALEQAKHFTEATDVTSIALTKVDGTAKGGVVIAISDQFKIPIRYIGVGEGKEQLQIFNNLAFVQSLFDVEIGR